VAPQSVLRHHPETTPFGDIFGDTLRCGFLSVFFWFSFGFLLVFFWFSSVFFGFLRFSFGFLGFETLGKP